MTSYEGQEASVLELGDPLLNLLHLLSSCQADAILICWSHSALREHMHEYDDYETILLKL